MARPESRKTKPGSRRHGDEEDRMKHRVGLCLTLLVIVALAAPAQQSQPMKTSPTASNRTDLYHVHFVKASPGKASELLKILTNPTPDTAMPTHALILRHLEGDDWDFAVIQHLGPKFTLDTSGAAPGPGRELRTWHNDTYAQGPAWPEFAKAMGIGREQAGAAPAGKDLYIATTYRGAAGHRAPLEETIKRIAASGLRPGDSVLLQHREGSPWDYLYLTRYDGWKDLAAQQEDPEAEARARRAGLTQDAGLELRQHMAAHHDTIAERVAIQARK
jgi:hypothetical protein